MTTRATTRTRLSLFPLLIALLLNFVAPVASIAVDPDIGSFSPIDTARAAADPNQINFTLEACNLDHGGAFIEATVTCTEPGYTTGNLGKGWNELDLVPHRVTLTNGNGAQTYTFIVAGDHRNTAGTAIGWDFISTLTLNTALSDASCTAATTGPLTITSPGAGVGGADQTIYRTVTVTQAAGATCVYDYYQRLALGAHGFSGASLQSNLWNQSLTSSGIGQKRVSLPVNEILPQQLSKTMMAVRGSAHTWTVTKSANPASLTFANTCDTTVGARQANVDVTVTWTRSAATPSGDTTITTNITATNPAHRTIRVNVTDRIYEGATQTTQIGAAFTGSFDVTAGGSHVFQHTVTYNGSATTFNDVATATYTDVLTGIPVPGTTSAVASATVQLTGATTNASALVTDAESITGTGFSFAVNSPTSGYSGYTAGTQTTGTVNWSSGSVSDSGSVTFNKTVFVDGPRIGTGTLSDTATVKTADGQSTITASAPLNIGLIADADVDLTINKSIPNILTGSESVTFTFDVTGPSGYASVQTLTFNAGDTSKSLTLNDLENPGAYTVHERPQAGWNVQDDRTVNLNLPNCSGSATFANSFGAATAQASKVTNPAGGEAGWKFFLNGPGATNVEVTTTGTGAVVFPFNLEEGSYTITEQLKDGWNQTNALGCSFTVDYPRDAGAVFSCTITNARVGVAIVKTNEEEGEGQDGFVVRGQEVDFSVSVTVTNGPADDVVVTDTIPDGLTYVGGSGSPPPSSVVGQVITWNVASLATGTHPFTYTARVDSDAVGNLENVACVDTDDSDLICDRSDVDVTPPTVAIVKVNNTTATVTRGSTVAYTLTVTVTNGPAHDVVVTDTLPAGINYKVGTANPPSGFSVSGDGRTITWNVGTLAGDADGTTYTYRYDGLVADNAPLNTNIVNVGCVAASDDANDDEPPICDDSFILVSSPRIAIDKTGNFEGQSVLRGQEITFGLAINVTDGPMHNVVITDTLPAGLTYVVGSANPAPSSVSGQVITWTFPTLTGAQAIAYKATVNANASGTLTNLACVDTDEIDALLCDQTTTTVRVPALVIDKVASTEIITISGPANALVANPSVVTWTLSYTLANGPVTGAVITDAVPTGFTFLDAANGGTFANGTVTWNLGTLTSNGSVTFRTTVNPATISRTGPTVNTAIIDSNETNPDNGQDSVTVTVEAPPLGGNPPAPRPRLPNTATGIGLGGESVTVPVELLVAFFIGSLGALALANVRTINRRR